MALRDFHIHTNFSDGQNSPEETVRGALSRGLSEMGFSDHSPTFFDLSYCMTKESAEKYRKEILRLKDLYSDCMIIRLGIEQDYWSEEPTDAYEYVIGSVHYMKFGDVYVPVDEGTDVLREAAEKYCVGDIYTLCETYFETVADVAEKIHPDIIGHFDLISKHNEREPLFDETSERYVNAWKKALDRLLAYDIPFEINTGAMSRGYKSDPYPSLPMRRYIREKGGHFILSSDSHRADTIAYEFESYDVLTGERIPDIC